jgi:hypothetical protein
MEIGAKVAAACDAIPQWLVAEPKKLRADHQRKSAA